MKSIITVTICVGLLVAGCRTGNYTWTPTAEEWARMTPMERIAWSANEARARQNAAANWQNSWNNYNRQQQQSNYQQQTLYELGEINRNLGNMQSGIQVLPSPRPAPRY